MTEKKMNPDRDLTPDEQQQLEKEQQFFKQQFSSIPDPKLPSSLSAQAMWEKLCAGEGDHQITVDPAQMEPQAPQKKEGKVLAFPDDRRKEEKNRRNLTVHRRRWAIACTLVFVVGLSAAYWKWQKPMEQMKDMVTAESAAEQPVEEVVEEAAEQEQPEAKPAEEQKENPLLKKSAAPPEEPQTKSQPQVAAASQPPQEESPQTQVQQQPQVAAASQPPQEEQQLSAREELQQQILSSMTADAGEQAAQLTEQDQPENAQAQAQTFSIKSVMEEAMDSQPQTLLLKNGSLTYQPSTGEAVLSDKNGNQEATLQLGENAVVLASETSFAVIRSQEIQTVAMTLYDAQELDNPQQVQQVTHQGELFDSYQSGAGSFTMVTSVWYTQEQVEAGEFLPQVNGEEIQPEQVNVINGYENGNQVNYLLTTTLGRGTQKTRAELYLN